MCKVSPVRAQDCTSSYVINMPKDILKTIKNEFIDFLKTLDQASSYAKLGPYGQVQIRLPRRTYYYNLNTFEKQGFLKKVKRSKKRFYILTSKAKKITDGVVTKLARIDGLSTIILFDIPEDKHNIRNIFRRHLLKSGYTQIQKSVFISPFKIPKELKDLIKELGLESNVTFIGGKIEREI